MGAPTGSVFISYRRGDAPYAAHALYGQLARRFNEDQLFMDVQGGILAGADFADVIRQRVAQCEVLVALIGPKWNEVDAQGRQRLDDPDDFVRIEIASALAHKKHVIPVLLDGASLPTETSLPEDMRSIRLRNAVRLTHENFGPECAQLIKHIEYALLTQGSFWVPIR